MAIETMDIKISELLHPEAIVIGMTATRKEDVLQQLVTHLSESGRVKDTDQLLKVIIDRERLMSTGIGHGVALPHGKSAAVDTTLAALALMAEPIDFNSLDDEPVNIVFLLAGTEQQVGLHLRLLSRISRLMGQQEFRMNLLNARTSEDVIRTIVQYEQEQRR